MAPRNAVRATAALSLASALAALMATGCTVHVLSPPSSPAPLESPEALQKKEHAVAGNILGSVPTDVFANGFIGARGAYRIGVGHGLELSAAPMWVYFRGDADSNSRHLLTGRGALKWAPVRHLALYAGLGGGGHAAGTFIAPDVGLTAGYENPYVVPFFTTNLFYSNPLKVRGVLLDDDDGDEGAVLFRPERSWGYAIGSGARVPLVQAGAPGRVLPSMLFSWQFLSTRDDDESISYFIFQFGLEIRIRSKRQFPDLPPVKPLTNEGTWCCEEGSTPPPEWGTPTAP